MSFETLKLGRNSIEYFFSRPSKLTKSTKVFFFLPPGDQSREMVIEGLSPWLKYLQKKKWVIISPVAPKGKLYFRGSEKLIEPFIKALFAKEAFSGLPIHLVGVSNGGISCFRVATLSPELFSSIAVLPGWPKPADKARLHKIVGLPVNFIVGEFDKTWLLKSQQTLKQFNANGGDAQITIIKGGDHFAFKRVNGPLLEKIVLASRKRTST